MAHAVQERTRNKLRPELELVICSARSNNPENDSRIRKLLAARLNWDEVIACAQQHKLGSALYERFANLDTFRPALDQKEKLAALARDSAKNNLIFMGEMVWLCSAFEAAGIPAIPFKGPALGWLAYQNFAHRTCVDLDFVVAQRHLPGAMALLQAFGYIPQFDPIEAQAGQHGPAPGQYAFAPVGKRSHVELHTERTLRYYSRPLNLDEMNSRLIPLEIGGQTLRTFSVEDLLVMLCVHGAKHFWERLAWIVDIAQLVTVREVDWLSLSEMAAKMESTRVLLLGLCLAHDFFDAPLPEQLLEEIQRNRAVQGLAKKVYEQYAGVSDPSAGVIRRALFRFRLRDGIAQGLRHTLRLAITPTESDRQMVRLPGWLTPLYVLVRPWRLLREYGSGLKRR